MVCFCGSVRQQLWEDWQDADIIEIRGNGSQTFLLLYIPSQRKWCRSNRVSCKHWANMHKRCLYGFILRFFIPSPNTSYSMFHSNQTWFSDFLPSGLNWSFPYPVFWEAGWVWVQWFSFPVTFLLEDTARLSNTAQPIIQRLLKNLVLPLYAW